MAVETKQRPSKHTVKNARRENPHKKEHGNRSGATKPTERGKNDTSVIAKQQLTSNRNDENKVEPVETYNNGEEKQR